MKLYLFVVLNVSLFFANGNAYRILGLFPLPGRSHFGMYERLMHALADRGHEVHVLNHFPQKVPYPRYTDINVLGSRPIYVNNISISLITDFTYLGLNKFIYEDCGIDVCNDVFRHPAAIALKNSNIHYDLVITEIFGSDCFLGYAHVFKTPVVSILSSVALPWSTDRIGNPDNPSYIPTYFLPNPHKMGLFDRIFNIALLLGTKLGYYIYSTKPSNKIAADFFGTNVPPLEKLAYNTSLVLVNSHFSINGARPANPGFIEVGGLHIKGPKPLPTRLEEHLKSPTILFSMGSMVRTETFPKAKLLALMNVFSKLPFTVLWKAKGHEMPQPVPKNIIFEPWVPQLDILCHPNLKLFISHGGMMGTQEAVYCGVPVLGMPLFADQLLNLRNLEDREVAAVIDYNDLNEETLFTLISNMLQPKYAKNAQVLSTKFRDRPLSAVDTATFWIEYVIRNKGGSELRTLGTDMPWYQYFMVDVFALCCCCLYALKIATMFLWKCLCNSKTTGKIKYN